MCQFTDRFYSAVRTLAGDGPVKLRLLNAWADNLAALADDGEIPETIHAVSYTHLTLPTTSRV